ncbi:phage baseplate assembly protein V [Halomonas getboli]|uniref:phage baseplate assembly protein V n=1 Tax=Halomonas getboli TaxID=2935862 RepID=UPI001FFF7890|nr:phage baseplate assembly protein V [Halomonas getboli]MCK2185686.1 phage baseplate assembly protein V [Halomonas getboli]
MREHLEAMIRSALAPYIERIAALEDEVDDLHRRARNQGRRGVCVAVDHDQALCRVRHGGNTTPWIKWASSAAGEVSEWRPPSIGEGCQLVSYGAGDDGAQMVAVFGLATSAHPPPGASGTLHRLQYKDGARQSYDFAAHAWEWVNASTTIKHDRDGIELMHGGNGIRIDASGVHLIGAGVDHDGTDIGKTHKHGGVVAGNSKTDVPS